MVKVCAALLFVMLAVGSVVGLTTQKSATSKQRLSGILRLKSAHKGSDKFSDPWDWVGLSDTWEETNGMRCLGNRHCYPGRWCSDWGWCQGTATYTPINDRHPSRVLGCEQMKSTLQSNLRSSSVSQATKDLKCRQYYDGCGQRVAGCRTK